MAEVVAASNQRAFFWPQSEACLDISNAAQVANGWARCTAVAICNEHFQPCHVFQQGETARFYYEFEILHDVEVPIGGVLIQSDKGVHVHGKSTLEYGTDIPKSIIRGSRIRFQQDIALDIAVGEYTFEVGLAAVSCYDFENRTRYSHPELHPKMIRMCHLPAVRQFAVMFRKNGKPVPLLHHGVANLPGVCHVMVDSPANVISREMRGVPVKA